MLDQRLMDEGRSSLDLILIRPITKRYLDLIEAIAVEIHGPGSTQPVYG